MTIITDLFPFVNFVLLVVLLFIAVRGIMSQLTIVKNKIVDGKNIRIKEIDGIAQHVIVKLEKEDFGTLVSGDDAPQKSATK